MSEDGFDWKGENYFIQKDEWLIYACLGMMYEFSFCIFLKKYSNWSPFHCYFEFIESFNFYFFFTFPKSFLWSNQFTNEYFLIIFLKHYMNDMHEIAKGLKKAWMLWRLTRKLPQFELVSRHKMCLGFP